MKKINVLKLIIIVLIICILVLCGCIVYNNLNEDDGTSKPCIDDNIWGTNEVYIAGDGVYYYNPVKNEKCEKGSDGCYGWYVLTYNDNKEKNDIELIMNKNLGDTVAYNENGSFDEPITALNYLYTLTSEWKIRVRMISINDVAGILNMKLNEDGNIGVQKIPEWLYVNGDEVVDCDNDIGCGTGGYWISDSYFLIDASRGLISAGNTFLKSDPENAGTWGVRPVIRVDKSVFD